MWEHILGRGQDTSLPSGPVPHIWSSPELAIKGLEPLFHPVPSLCAFRTAVLTSSDEIGPGYGMLKFPLLRVFGHSHSCPALTSLGIAACAAASPCGPAHNTWLALPGTVRATAVGKGGRWRMHQRIGRLLTVKVVRVVTPASPLAPVASPDGPGSG